MKNFWFRIVLVNVYFVKVDVIFSINESRNYFKIIKWNVWIV